MDTLFPNLISKCDDHICLSFLERLKRIYAKMDQKYQEAAEYYNFHCSGCEDSCCFTRFYHHTLLEYLYLYEGFKTFDRTQQKKIIQKASDVCRKSVSPAEKGQAARRMCPLNSEGLCLLYAFRPMICRLHGIPHELQQPGMKSTVAPGCEVFTKLCSQKDYFKLDRTPFYIEMAALEKELKQAAGMTQKIKLTVAEMIQTFQ